MKINQISGTNNCKTFGIKFQLQEETLNIISKDTRLNKDELHYLPLQNATKLMKQRGAIKESNKIKLWLQNKYKNFGLKLGLLKRERNIYTDVD